LQLLEDIETSSVDIEVEEIANLLKDFFDEPKGLPRSRTHDHAIVLKSGAQPVCLKPYRYPYFQEEDIEKIVRKLLDSRVIKPSQKPTFLSRFTSQEC